MWSKGGRARGQAQLWLLWIYGIQRTGLIVLVVGKRERKFSPVEFLKYKENLIQIEQKASTLPAEAVPLEQIQSPKDKLNFQFNEKGKPMVHRTDNFYHLLYPLEKRVELFSKCREEAKKVEEEWFGQELRDFVEFIMEKENYDPHMKKYCSEVREILDRYDMEL